MRKFIIMFISVVLALFVFVACKRENKIYALSELYPMTARVTEIDYNQDTVTMETVSGIFFTFTGCEDWAEGDIISAIIDTRGTSLVNDDEIVSIRYSGHIE